MSNELKIQNRKEKPLLLFSCLDWGLGHTTRSIPLLTELQFLGCDLIVACNSIQKRLLQPEFPAIRYVDMPGYGVVYGNAKWRTRVEILFQLRKILTKIKAETTWLKGFLRENNIDALISDNRYGLFHPSFPTILITHQLAVKSGYGSIPDSIARKFLYRFINRFTECWVPDAAHKPGLAGELSHPGKLPRIPVKYLGPLSRLQPCEAKPIKSYSIRCLAIISGPEPQRTIFENIVAHQLSSSDIPSVIVRGLPGMESKQQLNVPSSVRVYDHVDSPTLNQLICEAEFVVCRSGYTSMMDLVKLKKKIIAIPTPGQPEQEYLATSLSRQGFVLAISQNRFELRDAMKRAETYSFNEFTGEMNGYKAVLADFVNKLSS